MAKVPMLTTTDNPWNPATHWDEWLSFDTKMGYNTNGLLARLTHTSHALSELDQLQAISDGIDRVIDMNPFGVHKKIYVDE